MKTKSPLKYYGGKSAMISRLGEVVPYGQLYVEPFCGGASLFFSRQPSPLEVLNDINLSVVNFFRVLRDPNLFKSFFDKVNLVPYSRFEHQFSRKHLLDTSDPVDSAVHFFISSRQSFCGSQSWSFSKTARRGSCEAVHKWQSTIWALPEFSQRLLHAMIEHDTFERIFSNYDSADTVFYVDPPYVLDTINSKDLKRIYQGHILSDLQHEVLISILLGCEGAVVLSGFKNSLYSILERRGWTRRDFRLDRSSVRNTRNQAFIPKTARVKTESIWLNARAMEINNGAA